MKNKSLVMFVSSIMIAVFHLWVNTASVGSTAYEIEEFIKYICFAGVDMFFIVSAFSIAQSSASDYGGFIKKRFGKIYLKFLFFAIVASVVGSWSINRLLKVITGVELFERGGGSFLWFAPAILIVYLLLPLYKKVDVRYPRATPVIAVLIWFAIGLTLTRLGLARQIFIFYNRLPAVLVGFYLGKYDVLGRIRKSKAGYIAISLASLCVGVVLVYLWGYQTVSNRPLYDFFYILGLPLAVGLVMILDALPEIEIVRRLGRCTFEMYGLQMIFGFKAADIIYKTFGSAALSNVVTIALLMFAAAVLERVFGRLQEILN